MQESSRASRLKTFFEQRKKSAALALDISASKSNISPGSSPCSPNDADKPVEIVPLRLAMSNIKLHKLFSEFTQTEFKYERVLIWDNIQRFKKAPETEIRLDVARFIYDTFLSSADGTISAQICEIIHQKLEQKDNSSTLFDELEQQMENDLRDIYNGFTRSKKYEEFMKQGGILAVDRMTLTKRPALTKLQVNRGLTLNIGDKREMSPTVGNSHRYVGSPTIATYDIKSPTSIKSPTVGDTPRFVCSSPVVTQQEEHHKRVASPRDFLSSLLSIKKRKL
jgi:hypothetical protein